MKVYDHKKDLKLIEECNDGRELGKARHLTKVDESSSPECKILTRSIINIRTMKCPGGYSTSCFLNRNDTHTCRHVYDDNYDHLHYPELLKSTCITCVKLLNRLIDMGISDNLKGR